jgi:transcriptional regulator with XRE-family HTH domain
MMVEKKENRWKKFGRLLKAARIQIIDDATGEPITIGDVAARAGISRVQWSRYENGGSGVKQTTIPLLAQALGRTTEDEINEVMRWAGFLGDEEQVRLPAPMRHYTDLSEEGQRHIARVVEHLYTVEQQAKTKKRGK